MGALWNIFTWNTQGNFTAAAKFNEIRTNCAGLHVVVCIQEGGVNLSGRQGDWEAYSGQGVGAFNERCTNYVLVHAVYAKFCTIDALGYVVDKEGRVVIGGGEAGRTAAAVGVNRTLFVSWHSLSGPSSEDTAALVRAIDDNPRYIDFDVVVIGGDFNTSPAAVHEIITGGTARTRAAWNYPNRVVVNSGQVTHPSSDQELDFFIILSKAAVGADISGAAPTAQVIPLPVSDHEMVRTNLWL